MDIETRLTNVEEDVDKLKVQCAVAQAERVTKADLQEVKVELKDALHAVTVELKDALHASRMELKSEMSALEVRVEKALHAQTWAVLGGVFAMLTATVTIVYYMTS